MMNESGKSQSTVPSPVLLCRLCHCEFTNFKEHVKSLVHLDARETKTTPKPPTKNKGSFDESTVVAKKIKTENSSEESSPNEDNDGDDMASEGKESSSSENKMEYSTTNQQQDFKFLAEEKADVDGNGSAISKSDNEIQDTKDGAVASIKLESKKGDDLTKVIYLERHWHCLVCDFVQCVEDGSFDEHVRDKNHKEALACKLLSSRQTVKEGDHNKWLISCSACAFETNDKTQFVSHLQTEWHDYNVKNVIQNAGTAVSDDTSKNHSRKCASKVNETNTKSFAKVAPSANQKNTSSKSVTHQAEASKSTSRNSNQRKAHGANGALRGAKLNPATNNPKPLMSLSLPESLNKNKAGWKSTSAISRNQSASSKPGILGEYRPDFLSNKIGFGGYGRDDWFSRSTDLRSSDRHDSVLHSRTGSSSVAGRPTYSEANRLLLPAASARTFESDSIANLIGSDRYNSVWPGRNSLASPTEKLNSWAFGQVEQESPSRKLDILANILSSHRAGILPSTVSLDLASNSSINMKQSSDRDALFDSYPSSISGNSRTDLSRNNLSRMNLSASDHYPRAMYSRR